MLKNILNTLQNIVALLVVAMFFSCANSVKEVNDFLADKNLPVGESKDVRHVYKDSGRIVFRLDTPLLYDFSNRETHPYSEYPNGIKVVTIGAAGKDSTTVTANVDYTNYQATILNLQKEYSATDKVRLHIFVDDRNYSSVEATKLPIKNKGKLIGSDDPLLGVAGTLCYSLTDVGTGDIIIPFDELATVVSYDTDEMHMILNISGLSKGSSYEIKFRLTETAGSLQYTIGENNIFKVV